MTEKPSDEVMAAQCRKPHGEMSSTVAANMAKGNAAVIVQTYQLPELAPDAQVLEIGMGDGAHFDSLLARIPQGHLTGVDYSDEMVNQAESINAQALAAGQLTLKTGILGQLPLADHSVDAVFSINTLYFWDDPEACIQDLYRVIRPGGTLNLGIRTKDVMDKISFTRLGFHNYGRDEAIALLESKQRFQLLRLDYRPETQGQFATVDALSLCFQRAS